MNGVGDEDHNRGSGKKGGSGSVVQQTGSEDRGSGSIHRESGSVAGDSNRSSQRSEHPSQQSFQIRPQATEKFRPSAVQDVLHSVLSETLSGKKYSTENADTWTQSIAIAVRNRIKEKEFKRYKLIVQVVLGEKHGAGIKVGARCLWDADTDDYATASYANDTLFCVVAVFAAYVY